MGSANGRCLRALSVASWPSAVGWLPLLRHQFARARSGASSPLENRRPLREEGRGALLKVLRIEDGLLRDRRSRERRIERYVLSCLDQLLRQAVRDGTTPGDLRSKAAGLVERRAVGHDAVHDAPIEGARA